jgi:hypothetical protein
MALVIIFADISPSGLVAETNGPTEIASLYADDELAAIVAMWEKKRSGAATPSPATGASGSSA